MDISTLIFLFIAVVIFMRLKSVLGQRTGNERPPRPFEIEKEFKLEQKSILQKQTSDERPLEQKPLNLKGIAEAETPLAKALETIYAKDRNFDPQQFLDGAKAAYEMIIMAFAEGDRSTLKNLLTAKVFDGFVQELDARQARGENVRAQFVGFKKVTLQEAELQNNIAKLTVRFVAELIQSTHNKAGDLVEGHATDIDEVIDVWSFERNITSRDPNWRLAATDGQ